LAGLAPWAIGLAAAAALMTVLALLLTGMLQQHLHATTGALR